MKKSKFLIFAVLAFMPIITITAQKLEAEKTHQLSKDARKGDLGEFVYDEAAKEYTLVFTREKDKKTIYETYKFDYDFNQIDIKSEELSLKEAGKKYKWIGYNEEDVWNDPTVIRIDANAWGAGQVVLRKGKLTREWAVWSNTTSSSSSVGGYTTTTYTTTSVGYWKYNFNEIEKIKPKIEIPIELDPRTPKAVANMINNSAKKIYLVASMTDEPSVEVTTGRRSFHPKYQHTIWEKTRDYSAASGDIVIIGKQMYAVKDDHFNRYVALQYSATDLSLKNQTLMEVDYGVDAIYSKVLDDKSIAFIVAPLSAPYTKPEKPNPNTRAYIYFRVDKNANLVNRIEFESPSSKWSISNINLLDNGDVYIYGEAINSKNDKYNDQLVNNNKFDNFQLMKISGGKMEYITSTSLNEFAQKFKFPANIKKVESYTGRKFDVGDLTITSSGDVLISGQDNDEGKFGNITLFHFGTDGKLKAQYGYKLAETNSTATAGPTFHFEFENPDGTLTWLVYEIAGLEGERILMYPQIANIDLQNSTISDVATFGVSKKEAYYVDNNNPVVLIDEGKKVVFFGTDKKDKVLWFSRIQLGK